ncbi:methylenetetrahydrofolate reductase [Desulforudis sp. DRI-14]|uniref:methylenetetrahydrofolate reductase n=1 Tax=Desulforudis sp. DRI-14 TaxID=3459793 RepID=UPI004041A333
MSIGPAAKVIEARTGSRLEKVLRAGHFAVTAEIGPPKGADGRRIQDLAFLLRDCSDAQNLTDNQTAVVRLCSLAAAVHVLHSGGEPVLQMTTRDRNRIALQSDLLGAASLGVRNVLCLSGDHQRFGNHPEAKGVFDLDSVQLTATVRRMREERLFMCGEEIKVPPRVFVGAVENPFAGPVELRVLRLGKKVMAGAEFIQTQVVYDVEGFARWMAAVRAAGWHKKTFILAGVTPPRSASALRYMSRIPGMRVPEELIRRMEKASNKPREGQRIALEVIDQVRTIAGVSGIHIMAINWEEAVPEIVSMAGLYPRPRPN